MGSYLGGNLEKKVKSPLNGDLYVYHIKGKYILNSKSANYSFGELHVAFQKAFRHIDVAKIPIDNCLVLGFGTGSVVSILREEYSLSFPIVAVEKDPVVIKLGKAYFDIDRFQNLSLEATDANKYIENCQELFDFIVFDIYIDNVIPSYYESDPFIKLLKKRLLPGGLLLFNKDINNPEMKLSLNDLETNLRAHFSSVEKFQLVKNHYFFLAKN